MSFAARFGVSSPFDHACLLVSSPFLSPAALAGVRLVLAFYMTFALVFVLCWDIAVTHDANQYFSYFTELTGIGLAAYLWHSGSQTALYARNMHRAKVAGGRLGTAYPLAGWHTSLQVLYMLLLTTIRVFPIIVSIVFWTLLASKGSLRNAFLRFDNISLHGVNSVCALFEILGTNTPPAPWLALLPLLVMLAAYLGVAYITHATQGFYTYSFLDPKHGTARLAVTIVGIAVGAVVIFSLVQGMVTLRARLARKREVGRIELLNALRTKSSSSVELYSKRMDV